MLRAIDKWLVGYLGAILRRPHAEGTRHLLFCVADHFEPFRGHASKEQALKRVERWQAEYAASVADLMDSDGLRPQHTFFYPQDEYDADCVNRIAGLCKEGYGEVEIHLHHRDDTAVGLERKLVHFRDMLHDEHSLLGTDRDGRTRFGFIHGNWALCNSRPDGDWCGVNEELSVLREAGCYADFTFPSAPSPTQSRMVNSIYYAHDTPGRPRGHDHGELVRSSAPTHSHTPIPTNDHLMLIQGPLALNWRRRKWGVFPRLENAEISASNPPTPMRVDLWTRQQIHVVGRPEWVFVKVHTHGCVKKNADTFLDGHRAWRSHLHSRCNDGSSWSLHYVTARELYNIARAAEDGKAGNPHEYRDYEISRPAAP